MGDFNEVRTQQEIYGSVFNVQGANVFNSFISLASLIDLPLDGYAYTLAHKIANKMSNLDRFLVSKGLLASFPYLSALCLGRNLYDHRLFLKLELRIDYGHTPFRFCFTLVEDLHSIQISDVDKILDQCGSNEEILSDRSLLLKELNDFNSIDSLEAAQKSKVRIRGTFVDGEWIIDPLAVKSVFLKYFSTQFSLPVSPRIRFTDQFTNRLSLEQQVDLERNVSNEEIKSMVWDCGTNKSPGPDGFTFEFFRRYWKLLEYDIMATIKEFFCFRYISPRM
ncbi:RNA-directed DNA polymerase, eukaryota [Tanacetum coccineum]